MSVKPIVLIFIVLFAATRVDAKPVVKTSYTYYSVSSLSKQGLFTSLNQATPIRLDGRIFHGSTRSNIDWKFWWGSEGGQCWITRVKVFVDVTFTLPKLKDSPMEVYDLWKQWYPNLFLHEKGHRQNALDIARRIEKGIRRLDPRSSCETLERSANRLGKKLIDELIRIDQAYDKRTNHGMKAGASLKSYL